MTTSTRVTNAQIMGTLAEITSALGSLGERLGALEGNATVAAQPATGKARTRKAAPKVEAVPAKVKVLTRKRAESFRNRYPAKYRGLTREQMIAAGLGARGYTLPTGALRQSLSQG